jgi:Transposase DDE domain group 1
LLRRRQPRGLAPFSVRSLIKRLRAHRVPYSITVRQTKTVRAAIATIPEPAWVPIACQPAGVAQVAETHYQGDRLLVRRTRRVGEQAELFPNWRYHAFVTNRVDTMIELDQDHRRHAVCQLSIRDLKHGSGLAHLPSGQFAANAAWLLGATLTHNLLCWTAMLGLGIGDQPTVAKTLRRTLLMLPGRLTRSARRWRLHLPAGWPWAPWFELALARLRCIDYAT